MDDVHLRYLTVLEVAKASSTARSSACRSARELAERKAHGDRALRSRARGGARVRQAHARAGAARERPARRSRLRRRCCTTTSRRPCAAAAAAAIGRHPLRREITATALVNALVNPGGTTFAFRMMEETGALEPDVVRAHFVAWRVFDQQRFWDDVAALDHTSRRHCRSSCTSRAAGSWSGPRAGCSATAARRSRSAPRSLRSPTACSAVPRSCRRCSAATSVAAIAQRARALPRRRRARVDRRAAATLPLARVGARHRGDRRRHGPPVEAVAAVYATVGERLGLDWLRDRILDDLRRDDRWSALAAQRAAR